MTLLASRQALNLGFDIEAVGQCRGIADTIVAYQLESIPIHVSIRKYIYVLGPCSPCTSSSNIFL